MPDLLDEALKRDSNERIKRALNVIMTEMYNGSPKKVGGWINSAIQDQHRTMQQSFWSTILMAQLEYAKSEFDQRNMAAVQLAKLVSCAAEAANFDLGLPRI